MRLRKVSWKIGPRSLCLHARARNQTRPPGGTQRAARVIPWLYRRFSPARAGGWSADGSRGRTYTVDVCKFGTPAAALFVGESQLSRRRIASRLAGRRSSARCLEPETLTPPVSAEDAAPM